MARIDALLGTSSQSFSIGKGTSKGTITSGASAIDFSKAITIDSTPVATASNTIALTNKTIDYSLNTITNLPGVDDTGVSKTIKMTFGVDATKDSTFVIPDGATITDDPLTVTTIVPAQLQLMDHLQLL